MEISSFSKHANNSGDSGDSKLPTREQQLFVGTFISLSWQLLVVVLVPFIGGHLLDQRLGTTPLWTIIGLSLALSLAALTTYRAYKTVSSSNKDTK